MLKPKNHEPQKTEKTQNQKPHYYLFLKTENPTKRLRLRLRLMVGFGVREDRQGGRRRQARKISIYISIDIV